MLKGLVFLLVNMNYSFIETIIYLSIISFLNDDVPVGAIVVKNNEVIGWGFNNRENTNCISGHAEIMAINMATRNLGDWRLDDCVMYVTLKPCLMCFGAIVDSRIRAVYYLCEKTNVRFNFPDIIYFNKLFAVDMEKKYIMILQLFFKIKRC